MWRYLVGAVSGLLVVTAGFFFFRSGAEPDPVVLAEVHAAPQAAAPAPAAAPAATDKTREEKRFDRYDKDRNGQVTREEYLASRRKAFARLDTNHDGQLSFDEWAAKTEDKFAHADADHSGALTPAEFLTTKVQRKAKAKPACTCAPAGTGDAGDD
ncbi:MAG: EF-hand domain-containing protein [Sphingomonas sp.]